MRKSLSSIAVAGTAWLVLCAGLAACGDDDDDDDPMPVGGTSGSFAGLGGVGGVPTSGSGGSGTSGSGGTGGSAGRGGTGGSAGSMATDCTTAGCPSGQFCVDKMCRTMCTADAQCETGESCCDGGCIDTDSDHDNCGECGTECAATERCTESACVALKCELDFDAGVPIDATSGCPVNELCIESSGDGACMCGDNPSCPANETCSTAGACSCGDGAGCASAETCCGGTSCANLDTDENNCGKCGKQCANGATCNDGVCQCDEGDDWGDCNGTCVELDTLSNCGECGNVCPAATTCRDPSGSRPLDCYCPNVNYVACDGACIELGTTSNCGSCGDSCSAPETQCRSGSCECPTAGQTACGSTCVDLDDGVTTGSGGSALTTHCGACGLTCLPGAACNNGVCACPGGSAIDLYCDENPTTGATDNVYACIDVNTEKNCGGCGLECIDDSDCVGTGGSNEPADFDCACRRTDAGKTHCEGLGCRNLTETDSCGACGRQCPSGIACTAGRCACPGGAAGESCLVDGLPACVNTNTDENNCGECGTVCGNGFECCGGNCIDIDDFDTDEQNCGGCGKAMCPAFGCGFLGFEACSCTNGVCATQ
jgi:hypothetical protein